MKEEQAHYLAVEMATALVTHGFCHPTMVEATVVCLASRLFQLPITLAMEPPADPRIVVPGRGTA